METVGGSRREAFAMSHGTPTYFRRLDYLRVFNYASLSHVNLKRWSLEILHGTLLVTPPITHRSDNRNSCLSLLVFIQ